MWNKNTLYAYLFAALFIVLELSALYAPQSTQIRKQPRELWLTVFVHGIMSIKPHVSWNNFMLFLRDEIEGTLYEKTVELMREDPFFYKNQAMQRIGLHEVKAKNSTKNASSSLSFVIEEISKYYGIQKPSRYYTFGWTGLLSQKQRYRDAKNLFLALEKEVSRVQMQYRYSKIKVRLIGYSHGGNVILNLGLIHQQEFPHSTLQIDELVLLGTPIIHDTAPLLYDPMFKKVFNLYSRCDRVQKLDCFGTKQLFSYRIFQPEKGCKLPDKLVQIQVKVTRSKKNIPTSPIRHQLSMNFSKPSIVYGKSGLLRDTSPGHFELWFFGWTPVHYRSTYPLYPLPTVSFVPLLTYHGAKISQSLGNETPMIADIRPEQNIILFRSSKDSHIHSTIPYLSPQVLQELKTEILQHKPPLYTDEIYKAHIQDAVRNAQKIMESYQTQ